MRFGIPSIEAADHRYRPRIGRPNAEHRAALALMCNQMRTHLVVNAVMAALVKEVEVVLGQQLRAGDGGIRAHHSG